MLHSRENRLLALFLLIAVVMGLCSRGAQAACLHNDSDQSVYVVMTYDIGQKEGNLSVGKRVCIDVSDGAEVKVSIVPSYGGARFGCSLVLEGDEVRELLQFNTMNKCRYSYGK